MLVSDDILSYCLYFLVCCDRGGGDLLRQLHDLAEAESELSVHQRKLSEIEAKVDPEHLFFSSKCYGNLYLENPGSNIGNLHYIVKQKLHIDFCFICF